MKRWAVFGTGGMGREAADIIRRLEPDATIVFVTDAGGAPVQGLCHITPAALADDDFLVIAVGDPQLRRAVRERLGARRYGKLIARSAVVSPSASIDEGAIICEGALVNNSVRIGQHVIVNVHSNISHDCIIGDFVTVSPQVSCNGWVAVEANAFLGAGAVIRNGVCNRPTRIGADAVIGAGAVVIHDVASKAIVVGVPARSMPDCK